MAAVHIPLPPPHDDHTWDQCIRLLKRVYVGDGYSNAERAEVFMRRTTFEDAGDMLLVRGTSGEVVGAVLFLHPDGPLAQVAQNGEAEFRVLAVAPEARDQGIGEALVDACVQRARRDGAPAVVLWSQPTMPAAHRLYERLGFVRVPDRDVDDPRGFRRLVFRKAL